jgi:hypothetical protein
MPPAKPAEESEPVGLPSTCATGSTAKLSPAPKLNAVEFISGRNPADERADQGERGEQQQGDAEDQQPGHHRPPGRAELATSFSANSTLATASTSGATPSQFIRAANACAG